LRSPAQPPPFPYTTLFRSIVNEDVGRHPHGWEKVVRKLRARQMPPDGKKRPDEDTYAAVVSQLETALDRAAAAKPNPGRTATLRSEEHTSELQSLTNLVCR